jgi:hypothetical protein
MENFHTVYASFVTGASLNTAFQLLGNGPDAGFAYHMSIWNECPSRIAIAISTSAPTATTTEQIYIPANATTTLDVSQGKYFVSQGSKVYARTAQTAIVSNACWVQFW